MPTKDWIAQHQQIKVWLPNKDAEAFRAKCDKRGVSLTDAVKEAIDLWKKGRK